MSQDTARKRTPKRSLSHSSLSSAALSEAAEEEKSLFPERGKERDNQNMRKSRRIADLHTLYDCYISFSRSAKPIMPTSTTTVCSLSLDTATASAPTTAVESESAAPMTPIGYSLSVDENASPRVDPLEDLLPGRSLWHAFPPSSVSVSATTTIESESNVGRKPMSGEAFGNFFLLSKALDIVDGAPRK